MPGHDIHPAAAINGQLNRWLSLAELGGGQPLLDDLRRAATRMTDHLACAHELATLASSRELAGDASSAGALLIGAGSFLPVGDPQRDLYRQRGLAMLRTGFGRVEATTRSA